MKLSEIKTLQVSLIDAEIERLNRILDKDNNNLFVYGELRAIEWVKSQLQPSEPLAEVIFDTGALIGIKMYASNGSENIEPDKADFLTSDIEVKTN